MVDVTNYVGKLLELGAKCKFVVNPEVTDVLSTSGSPCFRCTIRIPSYDILVEQVGFSKKSAKAAAAQAAFEMLCLKINETNSVSIDKIASKLKDLEVTSDKISTSVEFAKKLASLEVSKININNGFSYSEINQLISEIQCNLSYKHDENKPTNGTPIEYQFICELRPNGSLSPVITGYGWSSVNMEQAKVKAITQLLAIIGTFSKQMTESS